jgi:predicted metalloendopeptidase
VGYSTSSPDVTSAISLSEYYRDVKVDKDDFFGNVVRANKHDLKQTWLQLGKPIDRNAWNVNPQSVTPTFNKELNKVNIIIIKKNRTKQNGLTYISFRF